MLLSINERLVLGQLLPQEGDIVTVRLCVDLRNQLALAYEGESENLSKKLKTGKSVEEIFRQAQAVFCRRP